MNQPLRLGIAGLGTVGAGVVKIIQSKSELLRMRTGRDIEIVAVSARSAGKDRGIDLSAYRWHDDPVSLAQSDDIDVFVELVGGDEGPAKDATEAALKSGKDVVTANKAMLAHHGQALAELAEGNDLTIRYEAAVAGGIPIIKSLTEGLAGNKIKRVMGVMNGTCNYILTRMQSAGLSYDEVFAEADALGYLEADPNLDVGGIDAGHKLALLSAIAYGVQVDFDAVKLEGIGQISIDDINHAADMGYRIKLLGVSQMTENGLEQRMTPCLVPETSPLGQLEGGTNMVVIEGDEVGQIVLRGAGAGEGPTASAVMSDVLDLARGIRIPTFGQPAETLGTATPAQCDTPAPYYLRLELLDRPGSLATVAAALGQREVSIHRMRQYDHEGDNAPVLIVTHATSQSALATALADLKSHDAVIGTPVALRIEQI
jgi:homoserine dehydrogenase